ncbi:MAG: hypothetical protein AABZ47_12010 [Planctomycetota bacterium]
MVKTKTDVRVGGISSEAVEKATGKTWPQWLALLDKAGAKKLDHKGIVKIVSEEFEVGSWWQQMVTVGYEQARGLREKHETPSGYDASVSKTIAASAATLFDAWKNLRTRKKWLLDVDFDVTTATVDKSLRIRLSDETRLEVMLYPKAADKTQIALQQHKLPTAAAVKKMKSFWKKQLLELEAFATADTTLVELKKKKARPRG